MGPDSPYLCAHVMILPLLMTEYEFSGPSYTPDTLYHHIVAPKPLEEPPKTQNEGFVVKSVTWERVIQFFDMFSIPGALIKHCHVETIRNEVKNTPHYKNLNNLKNLNADM